MIYRLTLPNMDDEVSWVLQRELYEPEVVATFVRPGEPVSKSRARFTKRGSKVHAYTPEKTKQAEEEIGWLARQAGIRGTPDATSSFGLFVAAFCGTWQRRDIDNMVKLVADGLTGVAWKDDDQVTEISGRVERGVDDPRTHVLVYRCLKQEAPTKPCATCGKSVRQHKSQTNNYCSYECTWEGRRERVSLDCHSCGKSFERLEAEAAKAKRHYCSMACKSNRVERPCDQCGVWVSRPKSQAKGKRLFCSSACAGEWRIGKPRGGGV